MTAPIKKDILALHNKAVSEGGFKGAQNSIVNQSLKTKVAIDGFTDVFLSLGNNDFMKLIGNAIHAGIEYINKQNGDSIKNDSLKNVFFISGSLGSKLLYEHIFQSLNNKTVDKLNLDSFESVAGNNPLIETITKVITAYKADLSIGAKISTYFDCSKYHKSDDLNLLCDFVKNNHSYIKAILNKKLSRNPNNLFNQYPKEQLEFEVATELLEGYVYKESTKQIFSKLKSWYMLTNQIALIGLKDYNPLINDSGEFREQVWDLVKEYDKSDFSTKFNLDVIAFHDPNDILTFRLPSLNLDSVKGSRFNVMNVPIRTGGGLEVDIFKTYKFIGKVDRVLFRKLKQNSRCEKRDLKKRIRSEENDSIKTQLRSGILAIKNNRNEIKYGRLSEIKDRYSLIQTISSELKKENDFANLQYIYPRLNEVVSYYNREKGYFKRFTPNILFIPYLLNLFDTKNEISQEFMFRFDVAHEKVDENKRVQKVIVNGLNNN